MCVDAVRVESIECFHGISLSQLGLSCVSSLQMSILHRAPPHVLFVSKTQLWLFVMCCVVGGIEAVALDD